VHELVIYCVRGKCTSFYYPPHAEIWQYGPESLTLELQPSADEFICTWLQKLSLDFEKVGKRFADWLYTTSFSTESIQASELIAYQIHKTRYTSKGWRCGRSVLTSETPTGLTRAAGSVTLSSKCCSHHIHPCECLSFSPYYRKQMLMKPLWTQKVPWNLQKWRIAANHIHIITNIPSQNLVNVFEEMIAQTLNAYWGFPGSSL